MSSRFGNAERRHASPVDDIGYAIADGPDEDTVSLGERKRQSGCLDALELGALKRRLACLLYTSPSPRDA